MTSPSTGFGFGGSTATVTLEVTSNQITDATDVGKAVLTAADEATARGAIGAGTSNFDGKYSSLTGAPASLPPSGAAGGDLGGNYPNPTVAKIGGKTVGTMATQNADAVKITGGTIEATVIGDTTPAAGNFTTVAATGNITTTDGSLVVTGPATNVVGVGTQTNVQVLTGPLGGGNPQGTIAYVNSGKTTNNRIVYSQWGGGSPTFVVAAFANDSFSSNVIALSVSGGHGDGITGITSDSGSGTWAHTGTFSASAGLRVKEGANAKQGKATLAAGTVTVANTSVTANSRIFLTGQDNNVKGSLRVSARTAGTSFAITSSDATDTGVVAYEIFEPGA